MNAKTFGAVLGVLVLTVAFVAFMSALPSFTSAANATDQNTTSTADINLYFAIALSTDLTTGIDFADVEPTTENNNATLNYNATDNMTQYWVILSNDSNTNVNLSISVNQSLTSGANTIPNEGYTWTAAPTNDGDNPAGPDGTAMTTNYNQVNATMVPDSNVYFRFYLDVPGSQEAGHYMNLVMFKAAAI